MAPITTSIDVDRPPGQVFAYVTDPSRFVEWQKGVVSSHMDGSQAPQVGEKCLTTRRIGFAERPVKCHGLDVHQHEQTMSTGQKLLHVTKTGFVGAAKAVSG